MLTFDEALDRILRSAPAPRPETVPLARAASRILARPARADRDLPPFDRAALDGYAVRVGEPFGEERVLPVTGEVAAGDPLSGPLRRGTCVRIMTGAAVPRGAEGIVPVERSEEEDAGRRVRLRGPLEARGGMRPGIANRGEDARRGAVLLRRGTRLSAQHIAVLAGIGAADVPVFRQPSIGILATGGEIVPPGTTPAPHQIRSSNDLFLAALLAATGLSRVENLGIVPDRARDLTRGIGRALTASDLLVVTGGVSAGRYDLVPDVLRACGVKVLLHKIALRPGKPLLFGVVRWKGLKRFVFGLPGNPVSVAATAHAFLLPFLRAWQGEAQPPPLTARIATGIRRAGGLTHLVPAVLRTDGEGILWAEEIPIRGSGDYAGASRARAWLRIEGDGVDRARGALVRAIPTEAIDGGDAFSTERRGQEDR